MTECDELITVIDIVSTKKTNVSSSASINFYSIKVKFCFLHTVVLAIILLLIIIVICYHYAKQKGIISSYKMLVLEIVLFIVSMIC